jgi:hypothetical protein
MSTLLLANRNEQIRKRRENVMKAMRRDDQPFRCIIKTPARRSRLSVARLASGR